MAKPLYSIEIEQSILAILLQHPDSYFEAKYLSSKDFSRQNSPIFAVISNIIENKGRPDEIIVSERLNSLGITLDGLEVGDFCSALKIRPVDKRSIGDLSKALKKKTLIRTIYENATKIQKEVTEDDEKTGSEIINLVDKYMGNSLLSINDEDDGVVNLDEGMVQLIEDRGNNPQETVGYKLPFKLFEKYYGGINKGGVYLTAARTGAGKSTLLMSLLDNTINNCNPDLDIKGLYIDNEMGDDKQRIRLAASRIGCPYYLVNSGNWRRDPIWFPIMRKELDKIRLAPRNNLFFRQAHNLTGKDLESFIKKWYYKYVGRGNDAFIIYDYLKPLAADFLQKGNIAEWQIIYQKMQMLKDVALDLNIPIWTSLQLGVSATTKNKTMGEVDDTEAAFSMSRRLDWLVDWSGILRKKLPDEIAYHGQEFGTHMLIPHKSREQGSDSMGHHNLVRIKEGKDIKYVDNFICLNIDNFKVTEVADFRQIAEKNGWVKIPLKKSDDQPAF